MKLHEATEIIADLKKLKIKMARYQDFENAAIIRDLEKIYMDMTLKEIK